jgi:hypothetical protein
MLMGNTAIKTPLPNLQYPFLGAGAEIAHFIINKNWSRTVIGSPDTWPQSLLSTLNIIFNVQIPFVLFWGPQQICFFNERFYSLLNADDKKFIFFGEKGEICLPRIWHLIQPTVNNVMSNG